MKNTCIWDWTSKCSWALNTASLKAVTPPIISVLSIATPASVWFKSVDFSKDKPTSKDKDNVDWPSVLPNDIICSWVSIASKKFKKKSINFNKLILQN